jgi:LPS-assembly protein
MGGGSRLRAALIILVLAAGTLRPVLAQDPAAPTEAEPPTLISADEVIHDQDLGVITARGNVEISHEDRILLADTVSYNTRTRVVSASGNVSLLEPNGDVVFGDYVEMSDDMREGFIRDVRVLLSDRSRMAAATGLRSAGNRKCSACRRSIRPTSPIRTRRSTGPADSSRPTSASPKRSAA